MFSSGHAKAAPGDNRLSQACANGFLSQCVCQAAVFLCSLFDVHLAWCLVRLTQGLACSKFSLPLPRYGNLCGKYFWNSLPPIPSLFPSSWAVVFPLPSTVQTSARCEGNSVNWNKAKQNKQVKPSRDKSVVSLNNRLRGWNQWKCHFIHARRTHGCKASDLLTRLWIHLGSPI